METASIWQEKFIHAFMGSFDHHYPLKASLLHVWPRTSLSSDNLALLRVWHVFLRPLILTATAQTHGVTSFKYMFLPLNLITASKLCSVSVLKCILGLSQLNCCLKTSPFSSSLTRSRRLCHKARFASTPTVRKSWCVWQIAIVAECEWSR